jgi:hypothetical protein
VSLRPGPSTALDASDERLPFQVGTKVGDGGSFGYSICSDLNADGYIDLADFAMRAGYLGRHCSPTKAASATTASFAPGAFPATTSEPPIRIGVFANPQGSQCNIQIPPSTGATLYVLAILGDAPFDGLTAAEFRVTGIPSGWFSTYSMPAEASAGFGNPNTGVRIAFPSCHRGVNRIVPLGTISLFSTSSVSNAAVHVEASVDPANDLFACPAVSLCDAANACHPESPHPKYTMLCAEGLTMTINGGSCTVDALEPSMGGWLDVAPNPSPGATTVRWSMRRQGPAHVEVHDLAGRRVRSFDTGVLEPGMRSLEWDGKDATGRPVASGMYFVHVTAGGLDARGRLVLVR